MLLCLLLCGCLLFIYMHIKEQVRQAYIHGAVAGAALGVTALYVLKGEPDAARNILHAAATNPGKHVDALKQRVTNLTDMFADVLMKGEAKTR